MAVLADDLLEGREAGTRGDALAQLYIRTRFEEIGLRPAATKAVTQRFRVRETRSTRERRPTHRRTAFANGKTSRYSATRSRQSRESRRPVFAGTASSRPSARIDDYRGLDVRGKVVGGARRTAGLPAGGGGGALRLGRPAAADRGGAAARSASSVLWTPALEQRFAFDGLAALLGRTDLNWLGPDGRPSVAAPGDPASRLRPRCGGRRAARRGAARTSASLPRRERRARSPARLRACPRKCRWSRRSTHDDRLATANVAGLLPGSDPALQRRTGRRHRPLRPCRHRRAGRTAIRSTTARSTMRPAPLC